jgi:hypothetical protein
MVAPHLAGTTLPPATQEEPGNSPPRGRAQVDSVINSGSEPQ